MTREEALQALTDAEVVPCLSAGVSDAKEILSTCLEAGIPAILERPESCGAHHGGCMPKLELCVKAEDVPRVMALLQERWQALLEREGTVVDYGAGETEGEDPPCPACGTAAPLVDGACSGCGLQLG